MTRTAFVVVLLMLLTLAPSVTAQICSKQEQGQTSDRDPVVICRQLFPSAPYVRPPADQRAADGTATLNGVVELDISPSLKIQQARFYDRALAVYQLVDSAGKPIDETSPIMKKNYLPSNRVHFLVYEAKGKVIPAATPSTQKRLQLTALRPVILVDGKAIDERFLGAWEGAVSKRRTDTTWWTDIDNAAHVAKVRITFKPPMAQHENIGVLRPEPKLPDGTRFEAIGTFDNATQPVRLSTGECAPAMNGYGAANPFPDRVKTSDYSLRMWRFPAMHSMSSVDFHVVFNYPKGLYPPEYTAMARDHNFRLKDYVATSTKPKALVFGIHGNPVDQIVFSLKPVQGGGGPCR